MNSSVKINKAPVAVDFAALDSQPKEKWKDALLNGTGNEIYLSDLIGEQVGAGVSILQDDPLTELPDEPIVGQKKEDESVLSLVKSAFNWTNMFAQESNNDAAEKAAEKKKPTKITLKKTVKLPPKKKATPIKRATTRKVTAAKNKLLPVTKEEKAREALIRKYRSYCSRFNLNAQAMTKTTKQLSKYNLQDLEREYQLLKAKSNEGEVEEMCYDIFEAALNMFAKIYSRKLKNSMLSTVYGQVDLVYIQEVIDQKFDNDTGDPALKRALAEASIEMAEWLTAPWYYRLGYHAHKIVMEASNLEKNRRISSVSGGNVSDAGQRVLKKLHLRV